MSNTTSFSLLGLIVAIAVVAMSIGSAVTRETGPPPIVESGLKLSAKVVGNDIGVAYKGSYVARFWSGVNLGSTVPGNEPGAVAAVRKDYDTWFKQMGEVGVRVIRVYTILRPDFYEALRAYDLTHPDRPLYVTHGIWIPEDRVFDDKLYASRSNDEDRAAHHRGHYDLYDQTTIDLMRKEIEDAVAVVHGNADIKPAFGHASGRFRSDISPWLMGWSVGVEWDPEVVHDTDRVNRLMPVYSGRYITTTPEASPTESWIASMLDHTAELEAKRGYSRPITFTNWVTDDPLKHPQEPLVLEDYASVDAMHVRATPRWPGGFFASYHAYPYYPDFLRRQTSYQRYRRPRDGKIDPYAGYLHELRAHHHGQAVMITEFGQPTSVGKAHNAPLGRNQGGHSEIGAATNNVDMLQDIHDEGFAGGLVFEWQDEWFKFTWNTVDYEQRRELWRNPLTNEEHFGMLALEPGKKPGVVVDGKDSDWGRVHSTVLATSKSGPVREVRATNDEEYLTLRLRLSPAEQKSRERFTIGFDVRPEGNRGLPGELGVDPQADIAIAVGPGDRASIRQAAWIDPIRFQFGIARDRNFVPYRPLDLEVGSGSWISPRQIQNRPYVIPRPELLTPGQHVKQTRYPAELSSFAQLAWGSADPASPTFDDRHLIDASGGVMEIRVPWSYLTFGDPAHHIVYVPYADGSIGWQRVGTIGVNVATPDGALMTPVSRYRWDDWSRVTWHAREKKGWGLYRAAFARLGAAHRLVEPKS